MSQDQPIAIPPLQQKIALYHRQLVGGDVTAQEMVRQLLRFTTEAALTLGISPQEHFDTSAASIGLCTSRGNVMPIDLALGLSLYTLVLLCQACGQSHTKALDDTMKSLQLMSPEEQRAEWGKLARELEEYRKPAAGQTE
jgi:hypothetical protein